MNNPEQQLNIIATKVVNNLKGILSSQGINSTGRLSNSINYKVSPYAIEITMLQYGEFVDSGSKPHIPPYDAINPWAKSKGLNTWAVMQNINKFGTKPHPWIKEFKKTIMNLDEELLDYMGIIIDNDFEDKFRKIWK